MGKIVFFDIDGTIWDYDMVIPESTKLAIKQLRKNGHKAILCTGRARASVTSEELLSIGFDGIIAACGTYIEVDQKVIYEKILDEALVKEIINVLLENKMPVVLEGANDYWIDEWGFEEDPYVDYLFESLKEHAHVLHGYDKQMRINKLSADILSDTNYEAIKLSLGDKFSILEHEGNVVELVPIGYSKATGIKWLCEYMNANIGDTYAIGDSVNDLEMLECVGHGIAMGNASKMVKDIAEYVTGDIRDNGVFDALRHYELI